MRLVDLLQLNDIDVITGLREGGSGYYCTSTNWMPTRDWLSYWDNAKSRYLKKMFKNELIMSKEISYKMDITEISQAMNATFYGWNADKQFGKFHDDFCHAFDYLYNDVKKRYLYRIVTSLMDTQFLASNEFDFFDIQCCDNDYVDIPIPNQSKPFRLQKGAKVSRAIGKLCTLMNIPGWEPFRLKVSQMLNTATIKGTLCLSIHPADYLTASLNENDWTSCMDFYEGEYRRGVIEMMNSEMVVCAYLKSNSEILHLSQTSQGGLTWNSKKWREFFLVNSYGIFGVKGYPYWNKDLEDTVINWLRELVITNNIFPEITFGEKIIAYELDKPINIHEREFNCQIAAYDFRCNCGPAMYNDFYSGNVYHGIFSNEVTNPGYLGQLHGLHCYYCFFLGSK